MGRPSYQIQVWKTGGVQWTPTYNHSPRDNGVPSIQSGIIGRLLYRVVMVIGSKQCLFIPDNASCAARADRYCTFVHIQRECSFVMAIAVVIFRVVWNGAAWRDVGAVFFWSWPSVPRWRVCGGAEDDSYISTKQTGLISQGSRNSPLIF